ncbi:gamma-glutamylcyclotransferase [Pseudoneobacillus sp. C159]
MFVFVYGTLRKYERNHYLLGTAKLISEQAWTYGEMSDTGLNYPMVKPSSSKKIYGEVYEINQEVLGKLDQLERYNPERADNLYERVTQTIYTDNGVLEAYLYLSDKNCVADIPYGDWKIYRFLQHKPKQFLYFAYGSCMDVERFKKANVDHYFENVVGVGSLENYSMRYLYTSTDGGRADIIEDGGVTEGILYQLPFEAAEYLFKREGYHIGMYRATFVDIIVNDEVKKDVLTFHVYEKKKEIAPSEHYAVEILRGSRNRVSSGYYQKLLQQLNELKVPYELREWQ